MLLPLITLFVGPTPQGAFVPSWRYPIKQSGARPGAGGLVCGDWNGDGKTDILVRTQDGVLVLDTSGKKHTLFPVGKPTEILALGQTRQGPLLIGFSIWGHSLEAYDRHGKRRWSYQGDEDGVDWAAFIDVNDPNGDAVVVGYNGGNIRLLDATGALLWRVKSPGNAWSVAGARLSRNAPSSIVSVAQAEIPIYDAKGRLVRVLKPCDAGAVYGADLDGDGVDEVLGLGNTQVSGGYLWVFDANGTLRWRRKAETGYLVLAAPISVGRFRGKGVQVAVGHSDGTIFLFGNDGTLLPGLKVEPDLRALCTLRAQNGPDALVALTSTSVICYTWQRGKAASPAIIPLQEVKEKDLPETPFVRAVQQNALSQVQAFLEQGVDPNGKNSQGSPVLIVAAHRGHEAMVQLLLERGAHINAPRKDGLSALMVVLSDTRTDIARLLIRKGADVNTIYKKLGMTALMIAVMDDQTDIVEALLKAGADVNTPGLLGLSPLFLTEKVDTARILLAHGATTDARNTLGMTPLMNAVTMNQVEIVRFLISQGANVNARSDATQHLYQRALFTGDKEMQRKIETSGKLKQRQEDGFSVLESALAQPKKAASAEIIEILKKAGAKQ